MKSNEEGKKYYLTVKGEKVEVSEEVYREYVRPVRREQRQRREEWKCRLLNKNGKHFVRCDKRCSECKYYLSGGKATGNKLSLDALMEKGIETVDENMDLERGYIEKETRQEEYEKLHKAIAELTPRQQEMVKLYYFEGKTQLEIAERYGITRAAVELALARIITSLKKILKNF